MTGMRDAGRYCLWETVHGPVRGIQSDGVLAFLGVPYGADTGGANRFRPPQPPQRWVQPLDATVFGPAAPQTDTRLLATANMPAVLRLLYPRGGSPLEGGAMSEDCLRVNVWAPADAQEGTLPVLVWLHGGAFRHGTGNEQVFNGDILSSHEQVVVVTVTHRLGIFGFLDLREFGEDGSANVGMLDIIAALRWVRDNIAGVGGDPENVTVVGQSGGSAKAGVLQAMPEAEKLFARAAMMSFPIARVAPAQEAKQLRECAFQLLGIEAPDQARALSVEELLSVQLRVSAAPETMFQEQHQGEAHLPGFGPSLDPELLPAHPFWPDAIESVAGKDLLFGWTVHEMALLLADDPAFQLDVPESEVRDRIGDAAFEHLVKTYPEEPLHLIWAREVSGRMFRDPIIRIADRAAQRAERVWVYSFEQSTEVLDGLLGSCHSLDLAYFFGTVDRIPLTGRHPGRVELAAEMMHALASFARNGKPQSLDGAQWKRWGEHRTPHRFGG